MNSGGESVSVVAECVLDLAEDRFVWRVGESLSHFACPPFQERLEAFHELADAGLAVFGRGGHGVVGIGHDMLTGGILRRRILAGLPLSRSARTVRIEIQPGVSDSDVARQLEGAGVIRSAWWLERLASKETLRPGVYDLSPSESPAAIVRATAASTTQPLLAV